MNQFAKTDVSRKLIASVLVATLFVSGCAVNPYVRTAGMQESLPGAATATTPAFHGDLEQAIVHVDAQRTAYYDELKTRTVQRNLLSGALIGLSAGALYAGVTVGAGASNRAVLNFGTAAGGAYALGQYSDSTKTELAYLKATNDLTCLVLRTRPWLVKSNDFGQFNRDVSALLHTTNVLDTLFQKQIALSGNTDKFLKDHNFERQMLYKARVTLRKASNFKGFVETAGFQLRQEAVLASNVANFEIHRLQPELVNPSNALVGLRNTSQAFRDIKPLDVEPPEAPKVDADDDKTTPPPVAASSAPAKSTQSTPPVSPTAASELGKEADKLTKLIEEQASLQAAHKKASDATAKKTKSDIAKLDKKLEEIKKAIETIKTGQAANLTLTDNALIKQDAIELAKKLSDVLAALRPVNSVLTRAYSLKPYVKSIPECQPLNTQTFEFAFDDGEVTLNPGQSFDVAVKGGVGVPRIWLSGAKGNEKGEMPGFTTSIDGGIARAKLTLLASTPPGEMSIMAVDGSGKQRDDIKVIVIAPAKNNAKP